MVPVTRFCFLAALSSLAIIVSGCTTVSQKLTSMTRGPILRPSAPADSCGVEDSDTASSGAAGNSMQGYAAGSNCRVDSKGRRIQATPCHFEACMVPRELRKTALPEYRVEPPDVLLIEAVNNLRPAQSPILAGEPLIIQVDGTIPLTPDAPKVKQQFKTIDTPNTQVPRPATRMWTTGHVAGFSVPGRQPQGQHQPGIGGLSAPGIRNYGANTLPGTPGRIFRTGGFGGSAYQYSQPSYGTQGTQGF